MLTDKRQFLGLGVGLGAGLLASGAFAQGEAPARRAGPVVPHRKATTTVLFQGPKGKFINGISAVPEGYWLAEQKETGGPDSQYKYKDGRPLEVATDMHENAYLVDSTGKVLKTISTEAANTSGLGAGGGSVFMGSNKAGPNSGVWQYNIADGKLVSHRQVPFGPLNDGGGIHGLDYVNGKLWIAALRLHAAVRMDVASWNCEIMLPFPAQFARYHGCAYDASNDTMLVVTGNNSTGYATGQPGLVRLDAKTGNMVEIIEFMPNTCDPHGLTFKDGKLISCDAGLHPGWPIGDSPYSGAVFQINIV